MGRNWYYLLCWLIDFWSFLHSILFQMTVFSINGWALSVCWPRSGRTSFLFRWQPSFLWSDACKKARKCNSPHTRLSLNLTSTCWSIFSKFSPCDLQVKDQGGYFHPAHPCVNHPHLKMKVTNKLQLYLYSAACPIFSTSISPSLITATSRCPPSCFVYPRLSGFVFLPLSFWVCKALNALPLFFTL